MVDLFHRFRQKSSGANGQREQEESSVSSVDSSASADIWYEKNRSSGNHLMEQFDDLENDIACLPFSEMPEYREFQKTSADKLSALQQNLIDFPSSNQDLSGTDQLINEALDFLRQDCIEELKKSLTASDQLDADILSSFVRSAMNTILKILDTVFDYGLNTVRLETSEELYPVKLDNLQNRLRVARAEFVCSQCEKNIMVFTREKAEKKQCVREITDTASLSKKAELATLKQTIRNLALDIEDLQAKWNSHYELSLISTDKDVIGLSDAEKTALRKQQEERLKEKAKQIEKNYTELRDHLNASKAVTDEAAKITHDLDHMFGGMLEREKQQEEEKEAQRQMQMQREALQKNQTQKERSTV